MKRDVLIMREGERPTFDGCAIIFVQVQHDAPAEDGLHTTIQLDECIFHGYVLSIFHIS
jgi:hypothetical protein